MDLWIAILVTCNLVLFVVWWLDRKSPKGYYHILKDSDEDAFTLLGKCVLSIHFVIDRDASSDAFSLHV